jgi:hypothetical protein
MGRFRSLSVNITKTSQRAQIIQIPKSIKRLHPAYCTIAIDDSRHLAIWQVKLRVYFVNCVYLHHVLHFFFD